MRILGMIGLLVCAPLLAEPRFSWLSCQYFPLRQAAQVQIKSAPIVAHAEEWSAYIQREVRQMGWTKMDRPLAGKLTSFSGYFANCKVELHLGRRYAGEDPKQPLTIELIVEPRERADFEHLLTLMNLGQAFLMREMKLNDKPAFDLRLERPEFAENSPKAQMFAVDAERAMLLLQVMASLQSQHPQMSQLLAAQSSLSADLIARLSSFQVDHLVERAVQASSPQRGANGKLVAQPAPFTTKRQGWMGVSSSSAIARIFSFSREFVNHPDAGLLGRVDADGRSYDPYSDEFLRMMVEHIGGRIPQGPGTSHQ